MGCLANYNHDKSKKKLCDFIFVANNPLMKCTLAINMLRNSRSLIHKYVCWFSIMYALDEKLTSPTEVDQRQGIITAVIKLYVPMETYCCLFTTQHYQTSNSIMVIGNHPTIYCILHHFQQVTGMYDFLIYLPWKGVM